MVPETSSGSTGDSTSLLFWICLDQARTLSSARSPHSAGGQLTSARDHATPRAGMSVSSSASRSCSGEAFAGGVGGAARATRVNSPGSRTTSPRIVSSRFRTRTESSRQSTSVKSAKIRITKPVPTTPVTATGVRTSKLARGRASRTTLARRRPYASSMAVFWVWGSCWRICIWDSEPTFRIEPSSNPMRMRPLRAVCAMSCQKTGSSRWASLGGALSRRIRPTGRTARTSPARAEGDCPVHGPAKNRSKPAAAANCLTAPESDIAFARVQGNPMRPPAGRTVPSQGTTLDARPRAGPAGLTYSLL